MHKKSMHSIRGRRYMNFFHHLIRQRPEMDHADSKPYLFLWWNLLVDSITFIDGESFKTYAKFILVSLFRIQDETDFLRVGV
jgi:hypothetical protein